MKKGWKLDTIFFYFVKSPVCQNNFPDEEGMETNASQSPEYHRPTGQNNFPDEEGMETERANNKNKYIFNPVRTTSLMKKGWKLMACIPLTEPGKNPGQNNFPDEEGMETSPCAIFSEVYVFPSEQLP